MIRTTLTILLISLTPLRAQETGDFLNQDPFLSDRYIKGAYLLYDCEEEHWVCAGEAEFKRCEEWREQDIERKESSYRCATFLRFPSINKCHEKQLSMQPARYPARFCLTPSVRQNQVHY